MKTYRIKEIEYYNGTIFFVQRKSIFGFWYYVYKIEAYKSKEHESRCLAKEIIKRKLHKPKTEIIYP